MTKKRILLVDNDKLLNQINQKILSQAGVVNELHIVSNGKEAIDYLNSRIEKQYCLPEIIILDLDMPVMNGFQFIDEFDKLNFPGKSEIKMVVFTASSNPSDRRRAASRGVKYYVDKPYLLRGLRAIL